MSHITKNKCNKKDNILIYNNLDKIPFPVGTMGQWDKWDKLVKTFPTTIHSPTSWIRQSSFSVLENHIAIMAREIVNVDLKEIARKEGKGRKRVPRVPRVPEYHSTK